MIILIHFRDEGSLFIETGQNRYRNVENAMFKTEAIQIQFFESGIFEFSIATKYSKFCKKFTRKKNKFLCQYFGSFTKIFPLSTKRLLYYKKVYGKHSK